MKDTLIFLLITIFVLSCTDEKNNPEVILNDYIKAANKHNIEKVKEIYADSIIWYFGPFTFSGKEEAIQPLLFDKGANTILKVDNMMVNGDTIDLELTETNDVLKALGVPELHHFPRFIIKDGLIISISQIKPPLEFNAYADSISAFAIWLSENKPEKFEQFWPSDGFNFSEESGRDMPMEVKKWRKRK